MQKKSQKSTTTAGLRGAHWSEDQLPSDMSARTMSLVAADGGTSYGVLYQRGGEKCVVMVMHPREFLPTHYLVPEILSGGAAVWVQAPRSVGNDIRLEHETSLLDVAAGAQLLRDEGYSDIVALGNSGGAGLYSFYVQQSNTDPTQRIAKTPGGKPTRLMEIELPAIDGVIFVSPHPGQGKLLQSCIDPSVTDEKDPLSIDESLFPFSPKNGFVKPPQSSTYSPDFVERYRQAQKARVERIDAWARQAITVRMEAKKRLKSAFDANDILVSSHTPIVTVWRTDADLRCFDLSLEPSDRKYGSLWGGNPFISNLGSVGFARVCTADSWLSTWSGLSSNAALSKTAPAITQPSLMIQYTGDNSIFSGDADEIFQSIGAAKKERVKISGNHHGQAVLEGAPHGRIEAGATIRRWLAEHFHC